MREDSLSSRSAAFSARPYATRFPAVVLFVDIVGFTTLSEQLASQGSTGTEELSRRVNCCLSRVIGLIDKAGGEIIALPGDAVLALWMVPRRLFGAPARRICECAQLIVSNAADSDEASQHGLALHAGIAAGIVSRMRLGGVAGLWQTLIAGEPLVHVGRAIRDAGAGEVIVSNLVWSHVRKHCSGTQLSGGDVLLGSAPERTHEGRAAPPSQPALEETQSVANRLIHNVWTAELRLLTIVFLRLPELHDSQDLLRADAAVKAVQESVMRYEGIVTQAVCDEKGMTMIAAFGMSARAHENHAYRAVQAGQDMRSQLGDLAIRNHLGITTGRVFCGVVGTEHRHEYMLLGDAVNLAARFAETASQETLCDLATAKAAQPLMQFEALPSIDLGRKTEVPAFRPRGHEQLRRANHPIFGREVELAFLSKRLAQLSSGTSNNIFVQGEAGIGKSRLVAEFRRAAASTQIAVLEGRGDSIEKNTPYHAWRSVFEQIFALGGLSTPEERVERLNDELVRMDCDPNLAPLLDVVLSTDVPETAQTSEMTGEVRADNTQDFFIRLLLKKAQETSLILILEDAHWFDAASLRLALEVSRHVRPMLLLLTARSSWKPSSDFREWLDTDAPTILPLGALPSHVIHQIVRKRLGASKLTLNIEQFIDARGNGNPFFSEELAYALRDSHLLAFENGECSMADSTSSSALLPKSLEGIIMQRIGLLSTAEQLTLKVASVVGQTFSSEVVGDIYPVEAERENIANHFERFEKLDLTVAGSFRRQFSYSFRHQITHEVAYKLMLPTARRELHRKVARWYEQKYAGDLAPFHALLAYHWSAAEEAIEALIYSEKAGEQAVRRGAYAEAVSHLLSALKFSHSGVATMRKVHWHRGLGEAYLGLGNLEPSRKHTYEALALLKHPVPLTILTLIFDICWQLVVQIGHRLWPFGPFLASNRSKQVFAQSAIAYERAAQLAYLDQKPLLTLDASLKCINFGERAGPGPQLPRAYASGFAAASIAFAPLMRIYGRLIDESLVSVKDPAVRIWVDEVRGLFLYAKGNLKSGLQYIQKAVSRAVEVGDRRRWEESASILGEIHYSLGEFDESIRIYRELLRRGKERHHHQACSWGSSGLAVSLLRVGKPGEALDVLAGAPSLLHEQISDSERIASHGIFALTYLELQRFDEAYTHADHAAELIRKTNPLAHHCFEGYAGAAEVSLYRWKECTRSSKGSDEAAQKRAQECCRALWSYAHPLPFAKPRAWLCEGRLRWMNGEEKGAVKAWRKGEATAARIGMPFEKHRAQLEIARHQGRSDPT